MGYRLGIDVGGTFTDLVLVESNGASHAYKVSSDPQSPEAAVEEGLELIARDRGISVRDLLVDCDVIVHGTTVVTNALLQRTGVRTGLLCTAGFRDTQQIRLGYKEERFDVLYPPPPMLVPRYLRLPVPERVTKTGEIAIPLDEDAVRIHAETFRAEGVEAVAVSFLWSFLNPAHERRVGAILAEELPDAFCCLSYDVLPQIREYDRTSTTILSAYVGPILQRYLERLEALLQNSGFSGETRYMQANAGFASRFALARRPIFALNSGPAAAPTAGTFFASKLGRENVITVDMGGTSFDVCLVERGLPVVARGTDFNRYRVGIPMVDVNAIGAGGGSIAWIDEGGILRVGPQSAEAVPGPACYGRGGYEPTVTDAEVLLGYFNPRSLLGGRLPIDIAAAQQAVRTRIADPLGLSVQEASLGIFDVVNHAMTMGIAEVSIQRGHDPRDFALVVGGGAGGIHAGRLASELDVSTVLIPKLAPTLCAFGAAVAEPRHDYTASFAGLLRELDLDRLNELLESLEQSGRTELAAEGVSRDEMSVVRTLELRYLGQLHECPVPITGGKIVEAGLEAIEQLFHQKHEALYAYSEPSGVCELINVGVNVRGPAPKIRLPDLPASESDPASALLEHRPVNFGDLDGLVDAPVYDGRLLAARSRIDGPAVIEEPATTIVVFPGSSIELDAGGVYVMTIESPAIRSKPEQMQQMLLGRPA